MAVQLDGAATTEQAATDQAATDRTATRNGKGSAPPGRRQPRRWRGTPYLLLLPALLATAVFLGWPMVRNLLLSFQNLNMKELIQHLERTGLAREQDGSLKPVGGPPVAESPDSDGSLRYVTAVALPHGRTRFYFEAARPDGSHV